MQNKSSVNNAEISHFAKDSKDWWDESGPFAPLHRLNPTRMRYIRDQITVHYPARDAHSFSTPLSGLEILDIGCGGGLVAESLTRMGAKTTAIDADKNAIAAAKEHAEAAALKIDYQALPTEELLESSKKRYDVVTALEIIEHVDHPEFFVECALKLLKPGGLIIFSTLNRTLKSKILGIYAAENILNWVPKGTHQHEKFIKPAEFAKILRAQNTIVQDISGLTYAPIKDEFTISAKDLSINYFITAKKPE